MPDTIRIRLLGSYQVTCGKMPPEVFNPPRIRNLIAYLTLNFGKPVLRQDLAFEFWADSNEKQAYTNLRQLLFRLRQSWPEIHNYLDIEETYIQWKENDLVWSDVQEFGENQRASSQSISYPEKRRLLSQAAALYQGDLFPECYEDWINSFRLKYRQIFITAITELISLLEDQKEYREAIVYANQLRKLDPLYEPAYQQLMRLHNLSGNRGKALQVFHEFSRILRDEFSANPSEETIAVYEGLKNAIPQKVLENQETIRIPLIGREVHWQTILRYWRAMDLGSHLIILKGEPGIGKTRLAEEFLSWVYQQGIRTASTRCYPGDIATAYTPITGWLRDIRTRVGFDTMDPLWIQEVSRILPDLLIEFPTIKPPEPLTESWQRQKFFESLARAIFHGMGITKSKILGRRILIVIDDIQWCDLETLEWIEYLMRFDSSKCLIILATYREEDSPENEHLTLFWDRLIYAGKKSELRLDGLDRIGTATLASHILNRPLDETQISKMFSETDGNPLFVLEIAQAWKQGSQLLPTKLQGVIETRLGKISEVARELANQAAVIGKEFDALILFEANDFPETQVMRAIDELLRLRLLREQSDGLLDFTHAKISEVVYQRMSFSHRQFLHRRVAESLIALNTQTGIGSEQMLDLQAAQIAWHFDKGAEPYQAFLYTVRAADHAARIFAYREAETLYAQAILIAQKIKWSGSQLAYCFSSRGRMLEHQGRFVEAVNIYQELQDLAEERNNPEMQCIAITRMVACFIEPSMVHNLDQADQLIVKGLKLARAIGAHEQEANLLWSQLVKATHYGEPEEAQQSGQACVEVARAHGLKDILAIALHDLSLNLRLNGKVEEGERSANEASELFIQTGNLNLLADHHNQNALISYLQADIRAARLQLAEADRISVKIDNRWNKAYARWIEGGIYGASGEWAEAQNCWEESIHIGVDAGFLMSFTTVKLQLGHLLRQLGEYQRALDLHQEALDISLERAPFLLQSVESQLAMDWFALGDPEKGKQYLENANQRKKMGSIGSGLCLPYLAMANVAWAEYSGDWDQALSSLNAATIEAAQRKLILHELLLQYETVRALTAMNAVGEAKKLKIALMDRADKNEIKFFDRSNSN